MRVNVIFLDYQRHDFTQRVKDKNFNNAGYPFDHVVIDLHGVSAALNKGIQFSKGYDAIVTMANDILMPDNWLNAMVTAAKIIPNTGMCGIHTVESPGKLDNINGINLRPVPVAFGNVLIPMSTVQRVGYFNPDFDPYGMQDRDYGYRLVMTGHVNYYLEGFNAEHIGHDVGNGTEYRKMKDEGLQRCGAIWEAATKRYNETGDYTINLDDWGEL